MMHGGCRPPASVMRELLPMRLLPDPLPPPGAREEKVLPPQQTGL